MVMPGYIRSADGQLIPVVPVAPPEEEEDDFADIVEVTEEDVMGEDRGEEEITVGEERDLFEVLESDVMGPKRKPRNPKIKPVVRSYKVPPPTVGGMRQ